MLYSTVTFALLIGVALSSVLSDIRLSNDDHVYIRLYPKFAQIFRSTANQSDLPSNTVQDIKQYKFSFSGLEFSNIEEETLTLLYTNVTDRLIAYHPAPNFEKVGTQYIYRRDPTDKEGIEIELVNPEDRLFREVQNPNRYFYLPSSKNLQFISQGPVTPYNEVTFICDNTLSKQRELPPPVLSYIDNSFSWSPRYTIEVNPLDKSHTGTLYGFADISNAGHRTVTIEGLEFIAGVIPLTDVPQNYITYVPVDTAQSSQSLSDDDTVYTPHMDDRATGVHVYETSLSSAFTLPAHSTKTAPFSKRNIKVERFHLYANTFEPIDARGKLLCAYNITSYESFIPSGPIVLYMQGRLVGERILPNLAVGETYTILFGYDADVSYSRKVVVTETDKKNYATVYHVEYKFKNAATATDVIVDFNESFAAFQYFDIKNIYPLNEDFGSSQITRNGTDLLATFLLPHSDNQFTIRYFVIVYKKRPVIERRD